MMKVALRFRALLVACTFFTSACSTPEETALEEKRGELEVAEMDSSSAQSRCAELTIAYNQASGAASLAQWDEAAAASIESISPSQEWEIRKSLGNELGLAPSEVNGWKDIYRSRAEQAKAEKASIQSKTDSASKARDEACSAEHATQGEVERLKRQIQELEEVVAGQS